MKTLRTLIALTAITLSLPAAAGGAGDDTLIGQRGDDFVACESAAWELADELARETPDGDWQVWAVKVSGLHKSGDVTLKRGVFADGSSETWADISPELAYDVGYDDGTDGGTALGGAKSEDAFFVRCDRSTMTQNLVELYLSVYQPKGDEGETVGCMVIDEAALDRWDESGEQPLVGLEDDEIDAR
jgi:hypothetical protein